MNLQTHPEPHRRTWDWRAALTAGRLATGSGDVARAMSHFREALSLAERSESLEGTKESLNSLGVAFAGQGRLEDAANLFRRAISLTPERGGDHGSTNASTSNLAEVLTQLGKVNEAEDLLRGLLATIDREAQPMEWAAAQNNLGVILAARGSYAEASVSFRCALEQANAVASRNHPNRFGPALNLGITLRALGDEEEARAVLTAALATSESDLGPAHPEVEALRAVLSVDRDHAG